VRRRSPRRTLPTETRPSFVSTPTRTARTARPTVVSWQPRPLDLLELRNEDFQAVYALDTERPTLEGKDPRGDLLQPVLHHPPPGT
jgi:hypothetical protein